LKKRINWLALIVTTAIIIDIEPVLVSQGVLKEPSVHGYLHTFLATIPLGVISGLALYYTRRILDFLGRSLYLSVDNQGLSCYITSGVLGWFLHVLLDSLRYPDIRPFYPVTQNPLYELLEAPVLQALYDVILISGFALYTLHFYMSAKREEEDYLLRTGSLLILIGLTLVLHVYVLEPGVHNMWLVITGSILMLTGICIGLKYLVKIKLISTREAQLVIILSVITALIVQTLLPPKLVVFKFTEIISAETTLIRLLIAWSTLVLFTLKVREILNNFEIKVLRVLVGDALLISTLLVIVLVGVVMIFSLLILMVIRGYILSSPSQEQGETSC